MADPTMHDVATLAGVSIKTVSNVINDYVHISAETRARVLAAIKELDYHPNLSARGLRSGKTGVIGLALPELRQNYFAELADAVIRAAELKNRGVVVQQTGGSARREAEVLSRSRVQLIDGLLFSPAGIGEDDAALLDVDYPLVLLGEHIFGSTADHVTMHNVSAARAAVEHLIEIGRRRIAVIGVNPPGEQVIRSADFRLTGYRAALESAGIPIDPALERVAAPWHRESGADAARGMLEDGVEVDAVFALNDSLALGVLRALGESGRRVPDDIAVIGFDNIDEARFSVPSLSSIEPGRDAIASTAVDYLIERIDAKPGTVTPPRLFKPEFRVVARESTRAS